MSREIFGVRGPRPSVAKWRVSGRHWGLARPCPLVSLHAQRRLKSGLRLSIRRLCHRSREFSGILNFPRSFRRVWQESVQFNWLPNDNTSTPTILASGVRRRRPALHPDSPLRPPSRLPAVAFSCDAERRPCRLDAGRRIPEARPFNRSFIVSPSTFMQIPLSSTCHGG